MAQLTDPLGHVLGEKAGKALAKTLDLHTVDDLLRHYPRRYAERGELTSIAGLEEDEHVTVMARIAKVDLRKMQQRRGTILTLTITDGRSELTCTYFNQPHLAKELTRGRRGLFAGKVSRYRRSLQLTNPQYLLLPDDDHLTASSSEGSGVLGLAAVPDERDFTRPLLPVYPSAAGLPSWTVAQCVRVVLDVLEEPVDPLPEQLRTEHQLAPLGQALRAVHLPEDEAELAAARQRLRFDEALALQLVLAQRRHADTERSAPALPPRPDGLAAAFERQLPFALTEGQQQVGAEVAADLAQTHPMSRLLQGEVGSGKTVVALRAMLAAVDAGRQAALLAPTEVLAAQHARSLADMLGPLGRAGELDSAEQATRVTLVTGSMPTAAKRRALLEVVTGDAGIVVGTHALIQDTVQFFDLGLVVVDEQHRFGVEQRDALRERGRDGATPHLLVMTATPIPRTVAMTVFGDLTVSTLRELPRGRSPIASSVVPVLEKPAWLDRAWERVREEVAAGRQAYVVCSRIGDDGSAEDEVAAAKGGEGPETSAVLEVAPELAAGPLAGLRVEALHGRLPSDEKDAIMRAFAGGEIDVLVATTVIEVGVDVPNATTMVIMDAERFGVSQLHQLRGRVGRGGHAGLCLLLTSAAPGSRSRERIEAVAATTDGFELAQLDLEQRREGDVLGVAQSGHKSSLRMLSLLRDTEVIAAAREQAELIVAGDPTLQAHPGLAAMVTSALDGERVSYLVKA
ncbi:ATP-dependent DNA helicase RecG [Rhodococcus sp. X156]|uniref:ATP-dependent DNA helicase RecG n=1 Tax=Rhodococcus sp. X156 TaxID=2499145 RepID=UPI000FDC61BF|nr:ATP-dependent DNA helicase RecG [Rhodococcus sp. X156]